MGTETEILSFKQEALEKDNVSIKNDIKEIKTILGRMENKLGVLPSEFKCPVHDLRMNIFEEKIKIIETKMESVHTKIISWSAVAAVILFIVSSFGVPYIQKHIQEAPHTHTEPTKTTWNGFPMPSPMPFLISSNLNDLVKK